MNKISIASSAARFVPLENAAGKIARSALSLLAVDGTHTELYLITERAIQKLNAQYRRKDSSTNVLSFCEPEGFVHPDAVRHLGEIYISPDFIKKHQQSLAHMVVHGILHLLGYDHETEKDRLKMEAVENSLLEKIGR
jgi:probable rRNA maturation factor